MVLGVEMSALFTAVADGAKHEDFGG